VIPSASRVNSTLRRLWRLSVRFGCERWVALIAVDFVSMRQEESRKAVSAAFKIALGTLPWAQQVAPMSRFGVIECAIEQLLTPLA
jgi:hypothetical protein